MSLHAGLGMRLPVSTERTLLIERWGVGRLCAGPEDDMLNTVITIRAGSYTIRLTSQQAALSDLRSSGVYATMYAGCFKNWHKENLDGTLKALTELENRTS